MDIDLISVTKLKEAAISDNLFHFMKHPEIKCSESHFRAN